MNLLVKPFGLIALSALFFASCKKENNNISLKNNTPVGVFFDTLELETSVIFDPGSVQTSTDGNFFNPVLMVGSYYDPKFGQINANGYTNIFKATPGQVFDTTKTYSLDSAKIEFVIQKFAIGKNGTSVPFNIYQLQNSIPRGVYYASSDKQAVDESSILAKFDAVVNNDLKEPSIKSLNLDPNSGFVKEVFRLIQATEISDPKGKEKVFENSIKGLAIIPQFTATEPEGGAIFRVNLRSDNTRIKIHYHANDNPGNKLSFDLGLGGDSAKFYTIDSDRSNLDSKLKELNVVGESIPIANLDGLGYVQGSTGVRTKIKIKDFESFRKKFNRAIVNRAEIILNTETDKGDTIPYILKPQLDILEKGISGNYHPNNSVITSTHPNGVPVFKNSYMINVTPYIQNLIEGKPVQDLVISPKEDLNTFTLNRVVLYEGDKNNPQPFKIRVFYTKLD